MRVLIVTVTAGGGHIAAAAALEEAWRAARPSDVIERLDLVKFSPLHKRSTRTASVKLIELAPELWGMIFGKTDNPKVARQMSKLRRAFPAMQQIRAPSQAIQAGCRDLHPLPPAGNPWLAEKTGLRQTRSTDAWKMPSVVSVVTDFEAHALWMDECVDLYCVATEGTKARLLARGATAKNVVPTGIPIAAKFLSKPDPKAVRKQYGLRDDQPVLLVLGGGFGMGPVAEILNELDKVPGQFQTIVVAGRNEKLRRELTHNRNIPRMCSVLPRTCMN